MVMSNHLWEEETRKYLTQVKAELNTLDRQLAELQAKRKNLAREVEAYEVALQSYLRRTGRQESLKSNIRDILVQQKNHMERLKRIAERNGGIVKVGVATDILYNYGLIKAKTRANTYRIIYGLLSDMTDEGEFKKIAPSTFRLLGAQQGLPGVK